MNNSKPNVVVITRYWPTALSVIRSLGSSGYTVDLVSSMSEEGASAIAASSKYVRHSFESICKSVKQSDDPGLLDAILSCKSASETDIKPVLFPTDDYTASFIDRYRSDLQNSFLMPYAGDRTPGSITALMNKETQSALASKAGLLCPKEWRVSLDGNISIPAGMEYPCFVKPIDSISGFKGEMSKCDSESELLQHLAHLKTRNPHRNILVQQFLDISEEIDLSGVSIMEQDGSLEVLIPAIIRKSCVASYERGVTVSGVIHPAEELGIDVLEGIRRMIRISGYRGIFDLELNIADGKIWYGELNLRSGGPNYAYYLSGINLPELVVKDLAGIPISNNEKHVDKCGISFVYEKVLWKEYITGMISKAQLRDMIKQADYGFIFSSDDPVPYDIFMKKTAEEIRAKRKKTMKKRLKRLASLLKRFGNQTSTE